MSFYYIIDTWSVFMYSIMAVATMVITWTYKGQEQAALLLPMFDEKSEVLYQAFYGIFFSTLALRFIANMIRIR